MESNSFEKLSAFFEQFKLLHYKKHETILRAEDAPAGIYFLKKGYVRLYSVSQDGQELTLIIFQPDDVFPLSWAFNNYANRYFYEAITPVEILRAPKDRFMDFVTMHPDTLLVVTGRVLTRMMGIMQRMEYLVFGSAHKKVASILAICAQRFGKDEGGKVVIQVPLTHKDIATLVGITRETASLEVKKLEKRRIIARMGKSFAVVDLPALYEESLILPAS